MDGWDVLKKEAYVFDHEVLSHCLWPPYSAVMVATHHDHVAGWAVQWAYGHSPNKIHLSSRNHVSYTGDGIKHVAHFAIVQTLFLHFFCRDDASNAAVEKHFKCVKLQFL